MGISIYKLQMIQCMIKNIITNKSIQSKNLIFLTVAPSQTENISNKICHLEIKTKQLTAPDK